MANPNPPEPMKLSPSVLEHLVDEHYANLYRFALSLARNEAEAADLTQQTYFQLATRGGQIRDLKKAKSWLFTTLRREFLRLRRQTGRFTSIDEEDAPEPEAPAMIEDEALRAADAALVMEALTGVREVFRRTARAFVSACGWRSSWSRERSDRASRRWVLKGGSAVRFLVHHFDPAEDENFSDFVIKFGNVDLRNRLAHEIANRRRES